MSEIKIEKYPSDEGFQGNKRTYMPYILEWKCTKCGHLNRTDFGHFYLSYPLLGKPFEHDYLICTNCDHQEEPVKLLITLELAE